MAEKCAVAASRQRLPDDSDHTATVWKAGRAIISNSDALKLNVEHTNVINGMCILSSF